MKPQDSHYTQIRRRFCRRILAGLAVLALVALIGAALGDSKWNIVTIFVGGPVAFGFFMAAQLGANCPYCGWMLTLNFNPRGFHTNAAGLQKICSHCKRDLTKPFGPGNQP